MTTKKALRSDGNYRKYFNCTGKSNKKTCTGIKTTISVDDMENLLERSITEKLKSLQTLKKTISNTHMAEVNALKLQIIEVEKQEQSIADNFLNSSFNDAMIKIINKKAEELSIKKRDLLEKIRNLKEQDMDLDIVVNLSKKWKKVSFLEKKAVANVLIQNIVIYEDGTPGIIWNY